MNNYSLKIHYYIYLAVATHLSAWSGIATTYY